MTNLKEVMSNAWVIAKEAALKFGGKAKQYFSGALKQAWAEAKNTVNKIDVLLTNGGKLWNDSRIYLSDSQKMALIGLETDSYGTGNIKSATLKGEKISNSQAYKLMLKLNDRSFYFDVKTNDYSDFAKKVIASA